jgi:hypothetical protein
MPFANVNSTLRAKQHPHPNLLPQGEGTPSPHSLPLGEKDAQRQVRASNGHGRWLG